MLLGTMKCNSLRIEFCKLGIKNLHCYCDSFVFLQHKLYRFVIDVPSSSLLPHVRENIIELKDT